jgi:DNA-binding response OmpR family regulator
MARFIQEESMDGGRAGKLLLVEDEHVLRGLIARFLRGEHFEVVEAGDGSQGVELYLRMGPFDVVLLDLNLPLLPGVDVCRRIKGACPAQPVVICSAAILENHLDALREMGVEHFLTKPYHPLELLKVIALESARVPRAESIRPGSAALGPYWHSQEPDSGGRSSHPLVKSPVMD